MSEDRDAAQGASRIAEIMVAAAVASGLTYLLTAANQIRGMDVGAVAGAVPPGAPGRGEGAHRPSQIPARGWRDILKRTFVAFAADHITVIAGGVTFSVLLAIFPALAAFVSLYGLVANVDDIPRQLQTLGAVLPSAAVMFVGAEMTRLAQARHGGLSLGLIFGVLLSVWSANGAMKALFVGLNVAYEETEQRGLVRLNLLTLVFTFGFMIFFAVTVAALAADAVVARLAGPTAGAIVAFARWPLLLVAFGGGLSLLYRYGASRSHARWRWVSWGSVAATALWLAASLAFSLYTSRFSHYNQTYGSLGAIVGLMIWIWISSIIVLLGAELNGEIERQVGKPMSAA
jgi:membrane protein